MLAAVQNNAHWCDLVCGSHGLPTKFSEELWIAPEGSPRFYPDAMTLAPHVNATLVLADIDVRAGCSVKDSFADLELGGHGFDELFEASWLFREPASVRPVLRWTVVRTEDELSRDPSVRFLSAEDAGGAIVNRTGDVLGVSNVSGSDAVWADLPAAVGELFDRLPLVGYEHGEPLELARAAGFEPLAPLRVWVKPSD